MKIHALLHHPLERPGLIETLARSSGFSVTETLSGRDPLPGPDNVDALIVMGGPMGVYETQQFPWLTEEIRLIRSVLDSGKGALGICLGSQLIAAALGCRVHPHRQKEIGWYPVESVPESAGASLFHGCPDKITVLHWHGDTWDPVPGMIQTYTSEATPNQAFQYGSRVAGLQFHPEATPELLTAFCTSLTIENGPSTQSAETILSRQEHITDGNGFIRIVWENWINALRGPIEGKPLPVAKEQ